MENLEPTRPQNISPAPSPEANAQYRFLRNILNTALLAMIVLSMSVLVVLLRQASLLQRQTTELTQVVSEYQKTTLPVMDQFAAKLQEFAKTDPNFRPILQKYFPGTNTQVAPLPGSAAR